MRVGAEKRVSTTRTRQASVRGASTCFPRTAAYNSSNRPGPPVIVSSPVEAPAVSGPRDQGPGPRLGQASGPTLLLVFANIGAGGNMFKRLAWIAPAVIAATAIAGAQDAKAVIDNVSKAMGAGGVTSVTFSGTAADV